MPGHHILASIEEGLRRVPLLDCHTHLDARHLAARGLHDILLYHMVISDLYAAGCPSGARLSDDPSDEEAHGRIVEALPYLRFIGNTSCFWGLRIILRDLYGWTEPITEDNWRQLDGIIRERAEEGEWAREVLRKAVIRRVCTEIVKRGDGSADDVLQYALEWAFFARAQWGVNDIPLYELEATWGQDQPAPPLPVTLEPHPLPPLCARSVRYAGEGVQKGSRPPVARQIRSVADVQEAIRHYCDLLPWGEVIATAQHLSTDIDYREVADAEMEAALARREQATEAERDVYASYLLHAFLGELERRGGGMVFQFSLGAEPLPFETASRLSQRTLGQVAEIVARYPGVRFMCFLASRHANQSLCTLARELPNFSLAGYWWHNFFPSVIQQIMDERLDMLPANKQMGFFSDAYTVEWAYAKAVLVRRQMAEVLARRVRRGQYTEEEALAVAEAILYEAPRQALGMEAGKFG